MAVLRCRNLPSFVTWEIPDVEALFSDDALLLDALAQSGIDADHVVWSDPEVDWDAYDVAVIRSTWDYIDDLAGFGAVMERIEGSSCVLANPAGAVLWNCDKRYLLDLQAAGVPVVPTVRASSASPSELQDAAVAAGWAGAVVKPTVGAGGANVQRIACGRDRRRRWMGFAGGDDFLLQPLAEAVMTEGELSFIFIGGELSHALVKRPAKGDFRAHGIYGGTVELATPTGADAAEAEAIVGGSWVRPALRTARRCPHRRPARRHGARAHRADAVPRAGTRQRTRLASAISETTRSARRV